METHFLNEFLTVHKKQNTSTVREKKQSSGCRNCNFLLLKCHSSFPVSDDFILLNTWHRNRALIANVLNNMQILHTQLDLLLAFLSPFLVLFILFISYLTQIWS